ncbi:MAG: nicotinate-nucleotide--dimethylbenzimidazole phosphoribosyltransferase [Candidatus Thermoplasmatota archaeon]|nr:nicotinate-nucleotide--dimethylbenzimidazole phosphoribosyltransferase [Candidatus Thermoplasmatota archaeon]
MKLSGHEFNNVIQIAENSDADLKNNNLDSFDPKDAIFLILAGSTEVSRIPGITSAGASSDLTMLTPVVDTEIIIGGHPISIKDPPMTPEGIPTPAIVTKACLDISGTRSMAVNAGLSVTPKVPFFQTDLHPALNPAEKKALPDYGKAFNAGMYLGDILDGKYGTIVVAESVPGGTTTAQAVISSMGLKLSTSSTLPSDPVQIKNEVVKKAMDRSGYFPGKPEMAVEQYGDYMMPLALGISRSVKSSIIIFAGGTQMSSVFYLNERINGNSEKRYQATTRWVMDHRKDTVESIVPPGNLIVSEVSFSGMGENGLRLYENGHVREGAGMGAALFLAALKEKDIAKIYSSIENYYRKLK